MCFFPDKREKKNTLKAKGCISGGGGGVSFQPNRCLSYKRCVSRNALLAPFLCISQKQSSLLNKMGKWSQRKTPVPTALLLSRQTKGKLLDDHTSLFSYF